MQKVRLYASSRLAKLNSVSSAWECQATKAKEVVADAWRHIMKHREIVDCASPEYDATEIRRYCKDQFWMSPTAFYVYTLITLSLLTHRLWIVHGISVLLLGKILHLVLVWMDYVLDDVQLRFACKYIGGWLYVFLGEGEAILTDPAAWKVAVAYTVASQAPTGVSYLRYAIRYKMIGIRREFLGELGMDRFQNSWKHSLTQRETLANPVSR